MLHEIMTILALVASVGLVASMAAIIYMMRKMSQSMECMSRVMSSLVPIVKQVELRLDAIMGNPLDQARHLIMRMTSVRSWVIKGA